MEVRVTVNDVITTTMIDEINLIDKYLNTENKEALIKQFLQNGYSLSLFLPSIVENCGYCRKIDDLKEHITQVFSPFQNVGNSSKNGRLGEVFASTLFTKRNPDIEYVDTAKIDKSGDAIVTINHGSIGKIMIDYKNYDTPIPSSEEVKLVRDLHAQNINYGILLSYKSKISKRKNLDYDIIDGKLIVFVVANGFDIFILEMAIQYLLRIHECNILSISDKVSDLVVKGTMTKINEIYETIYGLSRDLSQAINTIKENQDKMNKMFYTMINNCEKILTNINVLLDDVNTTVQEIHRESPMNKHSFSELSESISMCIDKEKDKLLCNRLLNICKELNISGYYSDKYIHFNTQDKIQVGKLQLGKSKVTMIFYNKSRGVCLFNCEHEEVKNGDFYITLSDEAEKWLIIERRFTQN